MSKYFCHVFYDSGCVKVSKLWSNFCVWIMKDKNLRIFSEMAPILGMGPIHRLRVTKLKTWPRYGTSPRGSVLANATRTRSTRASPRTTRSTTTTSLLPPTSSAMASASTPKSTFYRSVGKITTYERSQSTNLSIMQSTEFCAAI